LRTKENEQAAMGAEGGQNDGNLSELNNLIIYSLQRVISVCGWCVFVFSEKFSSD
jgi:hypothetical protein